MLDATDSAIADATATLVNTGTNIPTTRTSGVTGRYIFDLVVPGTYTLTSGVTFLSGYSYTYAKNLQYYDDQDTFLQQRTWINDTQPR